MKRDGTKPFAASDDAPSSLWGFRSEAATGWRVERREEGVVEREARARARGREGMTRRERTVFSEPARRSHFRSGRRSAGGAVVGVTQPSRGEREPEGEGRLGV